MFGLGSSTSTVIIEDVEGWGRCFRDYPYENLYVVQDIRTRTFLFPIPIIYMRTVSNLDLCSKKYLVLSKVSGKILSV